LYLAILNNSQLKIKITDGVIFVGETKNLNMNILKSIVVGLFLVVSMQLTAQNEISDNIINAIKTGNAAELAKQFNTNVEMTILDKDGVYSKAQAELILKDFFTKNPPTNFKIIHQGGKEGAKYAIGNLTTSKATYRINFYYKLQSNKPLIHQFRIEEGNE
jgi:hypothetical protein